jgi:hypothetical protein
LAWKPRFAGSPPWLSQKTQVDVNPGALLSINMRSITIESLLESLTVPQLKIVAGSASITAKTKRAAHRILQLRGH